MMTWSSSIILVNSFFFNFLRHQQCPLVLTLHSLNLLDYLALTAHLSLDTTSLSDCGAECKPNIAILFITFSFTCDPRLTWLTLHMRRACCWTIWNIKCQSITKLGIRCLYCLLWYQQCGSLPPFSYWGQKRQRRTSDEASPNLSIKFATFCFLFVQLSTTADSRWIMMSQWCEHAQWEMDQMNSVTLADTVQIWFKAAQEKGPKPK